MGLTTNLIRATEKDSPFWMVVLHGLGDSMDGYQWMPDQMKLPWLNYLMVNAPDPYFGGYSWFDIQGDHEEGIVRSRLLLFETLEAFLQAEGVNSTDLFVFGFSQGCVMTLETGMRFSRPLAGLIGVSGFIHRPESLLNEAQPHARDHRFLLTHGSRDPLIAHEPVKQQVDQCRQAGYQMEWKVFPKEHTLYGEEELQVFRAFLQERRKAAEAGNAEAEI
ncbi:MAG: hypothetical protein EBU26_10090 [Verrucomicrobia bacterium]|nr:hypothetical protein [Verrucomicrobiota bacterium]